MNARIDLPELHAAWLAWQKVPVGQRSQHFRSWQASPRPEWHGAACVVLSHSERDPIAVRLPWQNPYQHEVLPRTCIILEPTA